MKTVLLFIPLLLFALGPTLVETSAVVNDPLVISSSHGNYRGHITYDIGNSEFVPIEQFILEDNQGNLLYEKHSFGHTLVDIANTGIVVGIDFDGPVSGKGILHFYDQRGSEVNSYTIDFLLERSFSDNGNVFCVNDGSKGLIVLGINGEELYTLPKTNFYAISGDGRIIAAARDAGIDIYEEGEFVVHIPLTSPFIRQMVLSDDGSQLLFIDKRNIQLHTTRTGEMVFHYHESNKYLSFISCDISPDQSLIIAGLDEDLGRNTPNRHSRGVVYLFNSEGTITWSGGVQYDRWNSSIPRAFFKNAMSFTIETMDNVLEYTY